MTDTGTTTYPINTADDSKFKTTSAGAGDEGKIPLLDSAGKLDDGLISEAVSNQGLKIFTAGEDIDEEDALFLDDDGNVVKQVLADFDRPFTDAAEAAALDAAVVGHIGFPLNSEFSVESYGNGTTDVKIIIREISCGTSLPTATDTFTEGANYDIPPDIKRIDDDRFVAAVNFNVDEKVAFRIYDVDSSGSFSASSGDWSTPANVKASATASAKFAVEVIDSTHILAMYVDTSDDVKVCVGTIDGSNDLTWGTAVTFYTTEGAGMHELQPIGDGKFIGIMAAASNQYRLGAMTISGTTITMGTTITFDGAYGRTSERHQIRTLGNFALIPVSDANSDFVIHQTTLSGATTLNDAALVDLTGTYNGKCVAEKDPTGTFIVITSGNNETNYAYQLNTAEDDIEAYDNGVPENMNASQSIIFYNSYQIMYGVLDTTIRQNFRIFNSSKPFVGIATETITSGNSINVQMLNSYSSMTGLVVGDVWAGAEGAIANYETPNRIGTSLSATEIFIK